MSTAAEQPVRKRRSLRVPTTGVIFAGFWVFFTCYYLGWLSATPISAERLGWIQKQFYFWLIILLLCLATLLFRTGCLLYRRHKAKVMKHDP